jgi:hypothetical protein
MAARSAGAAAAISRRLRIAADFAIWSDVINSIALNF